MKSKALTRLKARVDEAEAELERCSIEETDIRLEDYIKAKEIYNKYLKSL